jgi:hypothetical protein
MNFRKLMICCVCAALCSAALAQSITKVHVDLSNGGSASFVPTTQQAQIIGAMLPPVATQPATQPLPVPPLPIPPQPQPPENSGFTDLPLAPGAVEIFCADSGNDANPGTQAKPMRTLQAAEKKLRAGTGDRIRAAAGSTFMGSITWQKSGKSAQYRTGIIAYGNGARPILSTTGQGVSASAGFQNAAFVGLDLYSRNRDPANAAFDIKSWENAAFDLRKNNVANVLIEDNRISYFGDGILCHRSNIADNSVQPQWNKGITVRRNIFRYTWALRNFGGQANYFYQTDGLLIEENFAFDVGWHPQIKGTDWNIYRHFAYVGDDTANVTARGNLIVNPAAQGIQARGGGVIQDNVIVNPIVGGTVAGKSGRIIHNAVLGGHAAKVDLNKGSGHGGFCIASSVNDVERNYFWGTPNEPSIQFGSAAVEITRREWTPAGGMTWTIKGNAVRDWKGPECSVMGKQSALDKVLNPPKQWPAQSAVWPDAQFIKDAENRPRGVWLSNRSAAYILSQLDKVNP